MKYMSIVLISLLFVACGDIPEETCPEPVEVPTIKYTQCADYDLTLNYANSVQVFFDKLPRFSPVPKSVIIAKERATWIPFRENLEFYDCKCQEQEDVIVYVVEVFEVNVECSGIGCPPIERKYEYTEQILKSATVCEWDIDDID